ncbi:squalene/phytoene synthase family protein [Rhodobacter sp. CCP-1]|uniref:Squalene/phytoene synthase family protein n=2 Tax=Paragemmobacter ruber TaxID=1985673 RepID=A0ABW9Y7I2_9RHOB|nr:squalene/phytoene synthase family protein [Rhodobacter ruber]
MAAPVAARERLFVLYAFNLEVARAPWVTQEPLIAEMRLQWWRDVVTEAEAGRPVRAHEVAGPLAVLIRTAGLPGAVLDALVAARRWDVYRDPFADGAALEAYLEETGAGLMWLAGRALGAGAEAEAGLRAAGWAAGLAGFLRAVPELEARGRVPLPDAAPEAVAALARAGLARLEGARAGLRGLAPPQRAATLAAWQAGPILRLAAAEPARVAAGTLHLSEFARRWGLLRAGWRGGL